MIPYHDYEGAEYEYPEEEPMTEEEWVKSMTTEQFADWLTDTFDLCGAGCSNCFVRKLCFAELCDKMPTEVIVEWLKKPHEVTK